MIACRMQAGVPELLVTLLPSGGLATGLKAVYAG